MASVREGVWNGYERVMWTERLQRKVEALHPGLSVPRGGMWTLSSRQRKHSRRFFNRVTRTDLFQGNYSPKGIEDALAVE